MSFLPRTLLLGTGLVLAIGTAVQAAQITAVQAAQIDVFGGYQDFSRLDPWAGSANTTFLGDLTVANAREADEAAVRLLNTGSTSVILDQGFSIDLGTTRFTLWDNLIGAGGLTIAPGQNVILSGTSLQNFDLSDTPISQPVISFSIDGQAFSFTDTKQVLHPPESLDESIPWTLIGTISTSAVPEPGTATLILTALPLLALAARKRRVAGTTS